MHYHPPGSAPVPRACLQNSLLMLMARGAAGRAAGSERLMHAGPDLEHRAAALSLPHMTNL